MEQNKYADELKKIEKLEQKIAIKEANGIDSSADEREKEIAMLELLDKSKDDIPKPKVVSAAEIEAKRMINNTKKQVMNTVSKEYCIALLDVLNEYLNKCDNMFETNDVDAIIYACDMLGEFLIRMNSSFYKYSNDSKPHDNIPDLRATYPALNHDYDELNKEDSIKMVHIIFVKMKELNKDVKTALHNNDLWLVLQLSQLYGCYSFVLNDLRFQISD